MPVHQLDFILIFFLLFLVSLFVMSTIDYKTIDDEVSNYYSAKIIPKIIEACVITSYYINGSVKCVIFDDIETYAQDKTIRFIYRNVEYSINLSYIPYTIIGVSSNVIQIYKFGETLYIS